MRLPYLQIAMEVSEQHGPELAETLGINLAEAVGSIVLLYGIAMSKCPDNVPPSEAPPLLGAAAATLEARVCWKGEGRAPGAWIHAAELAGLLVREHGGAIRVRGLDRYDSMFREREAAKERRQSALERRRVGEPSANRRRTVGDETRPVASQTQTQTQTQTQVETALSLAPARARDQAQDTPSPWAHFLTHVRTVRESAPRNWVVDAPDAGLLKAFVETQLAAAVHKGLAPDKSAALPLLCKAYSLYVEAKTDLDPGRAPWRFFVKDVAEYLARAAEGRPARDPPRQAKPENMRGFVDVSKQNHHGEVNFEF